MPQKLGDNKLCAFEAQAFIPWTMNADHLTKVTDPSLDLSRDDSAQASSSQSSVISPNFSTPELLCCDLHGRRRHGVPARSTRFSLVMYPGLSTHWPVLCCPGAVRLGVATYGQGWRALAFPCPNPLTHGKGLEIASVAAISTQLRQRHFTLVGHKDPPRTQWRHQ